MRRAITLRSLVRTISGRSSGESGELASGPQFGSTAATSPNRVSPVKSSLYDTQSTCPHLVSVARKDSARCAGQMGLDGARPDHAPNGFASVASTVRRLSSGLFGTGLKAPRRAHSAARANCEKAASADEPPMDDEPIQRSLSLPRNDPVRQSSASSLRDASANIGATMADKCNNINNNNNTNKRLDGMKSGK